MFNDRDAKVLVAGTHSMLVILEFLSVLLCSSFHLSLTHPAKIHIR